MEQTKFLGKFPYKVMLSHETQRILEVSDQTGRYNTNLSFAYYPEQIEISTAMSHEGIDKHLIPRLNLLRELYNAISQDLKIARSANGEILWDFALTRKVLPPRFYLSVDQQGTLKNRKGESLETLSQPYHNLVEEIKRQYGVSETQVTDDFLKEERIIIPIRKGFSIQISKPLHHTQTFEIHADNEANYENLAPISESLGPLIEKTLGEKLKLHSTRYTNCHFYITLDISTTRALTGKSLDKLLLKS